MATIDNGMSMMNVEAYWQYIMKGIGLVVAVCSSATLEKNLNRR